jgi:hypothetical protein
MLSGVLGWSLLGPLMGIPDDNGPSGIVPAGATGSDYSATAPGVTLAGTDSATNGVADSSGLATTSSSQSEPSAPPPSQSPAFSSLNDGLLSTGLSNSDMLQRLAAVKMHPHSGHHAAAASSFTGGAAALAARLGGLTSGSAASTPIGSTAPIVHVIPPSHGSSGHLTPNVIVNVIPNAFSAETTYQSEPSITVNPLDPTQIVIATFGPLPGRNGNPDFTSVDGGMTWDNYSFHNYSHGDTSLDWSASGTAYQVMLTVSQIVPRSSPDPTTNDPANQFIAIPGGGYTNGSNDQPWIRAAQGADGQDHIYVGFNLNRSNVRMSLDSGATWVNQLLDRVTTGIGDAPPTRLAINGDTVYATFERRMSNFMGDYRGDVAIVRSDNAGADGFQALGNLGTTIAQDVVLPAPDYPSNNGTLLGHERIRSSTAIAVDPNDPMTVYDAYTIVENGAAHVHLTLSTDGGVTWADVFSVPDASALPSLAITDSGVVGMLYTSLVDGNMQTHLVESADGFNTYNDDFLFSFVDGDPRFISSPYIGDYENIRTVGETFYGTFTASNNFNTAYSPYPVVLQREYYIDPDTGEFFLRNLSGGNVAFSLDPYFFAEDANPPA